VTTGSRVMGHAEQIDSENHLLFSDPCPMTRDPRVPMREDIDDE
jgi:hypothetical protein